LELRRVPPFARLHKQPPIDINIGRLLSLGSGPKNGGHYNPATGNIRYLSMSCGGCPGRATLRKLINLKKGLKKREQTYSGMVRVHLSTCITHSNHHGPRCPHVDYIKGQIERAGLDCVEGSRISPAAEKRRSEGRYQE
ncbi:MAG: CGGC domain-containing protein, partial [Planctomycetota bacterium]|nr:CGGC domain-containing protein [Planctomycetota bacterium]